jgi:hypothetical protein
VSDKTYERSGIVGFLLSTPPREGDRIRVQYLARAPRWSRIVGEIKVASSSR